MTCRAIVELCKAIEGDAVVIGASLPVNVTFVPVAVNFLQSIEVVIEERTE